MKSFLIALSFLIASFSAQAEQYVITDYTTDPVTTAAWVEIIPQAQYAANKIHVFDSSGQTLLVGVGAPGQEQVVAVIPPGGQELILTNIPQKARISLRAVSNSTSGNAVAGENVFVLVKTL